MESWFEKELTEEQNSHIDIFTYIINENKNEKHLIQVSKII